MTQISPGERRATAGPTAPTDPIPPEPAVDGLSALDHVRLRAVDLTDARPWHAHPRVVDAAERAPLAAGDASPPESTIQTWTQPAAVDRIGHLRSRGVVRQVPQQRTRFTAVPAPRRTPTPRVSVVIPTFNEAKNLPSVLDALPADVHEVIVVDGNSIDGTVEVARALRPDVRIVLQNRTGKGNAMACGFAAVTGDVVVMLDSDGSAHPGEIPRFIAALVAGSDYAKGTRFADGGGSSDITPLRAWGNRWLNRLANVLFRTRYTDLCYGYNAFWTDCLAYLDLDPRRGTGGRRLWGDGFEIETIINTRMAKASMRIAEVPSFEHPRLHGESHLNTWRDGTRVLRALLVERLNDVGVRQAAGSPHGIGRRRRTRPGHAAETRRRRDWRRAPRGERCSSLGRQG